MILEHVTVTRTHDGLRAAILCCVVLISLTFLPIDKQSQVVPGKPSANITVILTIQRGFDAAVVSVIM